MFPSQANPIPPCADRRDLPRRVDAFLKLQPRAVEHRWQEPDAMGHIDLRLGFAPVDPGEEQMPPRPRYRKLVQKGKTEGKGRPTPR